jgi:hypothetical protein
MRKSGSRDLVKRKRKRILSGLEERELVKDYEDGFSIVFLCNKYSISKSYISNMFKRRNLKKRIAHSDIKLWKTFKENNLENNISGVYAIYFTYNYNEADRLSFSKVNDIKVYFGSSCDIKSRLMSHISDLKQDTHINKKIQHYYNDKNYTTNFAIVEECGESDLLIKETETMYRFNESCLLNTWKNYSLEKILPWLEKAISTKSYQDYKISKEGCWEHNNIGADGYGRIKIKLNEDFGTNITKELKSHRVAYWEKYGEYPGLIRHKCNNKRCRNPEHLESGSHRQNQLDKRGDFPILFEEKWVEFKGDVELLTEYFGWKPNCSWHGKKVSATVYEWEKKLGIREKHLDILNSSNSRKRSIGRIG